MRVAEVTYLVRMRTILRPAAAVVVLVAALAATACTPAPQPPRTPAPSSTPLFASDEEALAAAEEAYAAYQAVEDQILAEGGIGGDRIQPYATREALQAAIEGFESYRLNGYHSVGSTGFDFIGLQSNSLGTDGGNDAVAAYVCLDFSQSDVLDANGNSVVREGRPLRQEFEVSFDKGTDGGTIVLASRNPWNGNDTCSA